MWSSPHKKRKPTPPSTSPQRAGNSAKHSAGNEPGKLFRDPKGKIHEVPRKRKSRKRS